MSNVTIIAASKILGSDNIVVVTLRQAYKAILDTISTTLHITMYYLLVTII